MYINMYIFTTSHYSGGMDVSEGSAVVSVADARASLSQTLKRFRSEASPAPIVLGSHRRAEAVLVRYRDYRVLLDAQDLVTRSSTLDQLMEKRDLVRRLAALNNIGAVSVFGSVARGDEQPTSDIDLLVEPTESTSLFDLAQFAIDVEQVFDRSVDVVSSRSLIPSRDAAILQQAIAL
jgi:predicted nucleotidyltransferase